jgi:hypothetical protein
MSGFFLLLPKRGKDDGKTPWYEVVVVAAFLLVIIACVVGIAIVLFT